MPSYIVTVDGAKYKVNSDKELTSSEAYNYALSQKPKPSFISQQANELADIGTGIIGEAAKFAGRVIPGVTGEQLQQKTLSALTPKNYTLNKDAVSAGQFLTDVGAGFALPTGVASLASKIPSIAKFAPAIASSGADLAGAKTTNALANLGLRTGIGAGTGASISGLINPDDIGTGALVGGLFANAPVVANYITDRGARRLMQSAIKPSAANLESGDAGRAVTTMLEEGVNPTQGRTIFGKGLDTLQKKVTNLNTQISDIIKNSQGSVNKNTVVSYLDDLEKKALMQVAPESDLSAIQSVRDQFMAHPLAQGDTIPVQLAQELKKGTYKSLGGKAYGEISSASKEAQKGIARGLKEGIVGAEPAVAGLNAQESRLLNALNVSERRALIEANKDIAGLGSITPDLGRTLAFMADRNSAFKALLARMLYSTGKAMPTAPQGLLGVAPAITSGQEQ